MFCRSLFVIFSLFCWPLLCLSFDLRLLITLLLPSNFSYQLRIILMTFVLLGKVCFDKLFLKYLIVHRVIYVINDLGNINLHCIRYSNLHLNAN